MIPQSGNGMNYNIYLYSFSKDGLDYSASYYPIVYPAKGIKNETSILLDNMVQGAASNSCGKVLTSSEVQYKSYLGREYSIELPEGYITKCRMYIIERKVYILSVIAENKSKIHENASLINAFLNSFSTGESKEDVKILPKKKTAELTVSDIEAFSLSENNAVTFDLEGRGWKYVGTHNLEIFGTGYQFVYSGNNAFSQIICYLDKNTIFYVPDSTLSSNLIDQIKNAYVYVRTQKFAGSKQDVYRQDKFTIYVSYLERTTFTLVYNVTI